ncbi:hypothetical protein PVAP13_6KG363306 [Panicum virgatum]|uniref:Uncharacterized protein n=1 Tax=Panicum virgatum TaxID=38727 RepID=A0A8T0RIP8_PANVG|nr:hypothetical protein PVAP13_6KG363306 [Panicum virgatum]
MTRTEWTAERPRLRLVRRPVRRRPVRRRRAYPRGTPWLARVPPSCRAEVRCLRSRLARRCPVTTEHLLLAARLLSRRCIRGARHQDETKPSPEGRASAALPIALVP